ncbi:hypothetical protein HYY69_03275 [Candidatus Woesearchaeota archaeon]|nr:hypothetical protein [Candidatus Woesearchaeota archaeon]
MVTIDPDLIGEDELSLIKCLLNYKHRIKEYQKYSKDFKKIISSNLNPENGYLNFNLVYSTQYREQDINDEICKLKNGSKIIFQSNRGNISKTARTLESKGFIKIGEFKFKDKKNRPKGDRKYRQILVFKIKNDETTFRRLLLIFFTIDNFNFFINSDYYFDNQKIIDDYFKEIIKILSMNFDLGYDIKKIKKLEKECNQMQLNDVKKWFILQPHILAIYLFNPNRFKVVVKTIQDNFRVNKIPEAFSSIIFLMSFSISSLIVSIDKFKKDPSHSKNLLNIFRALDLESNKLNNYLECYAKAYILNNLNKFKEASNKNSAMAITPTKS